MSHLIKAYFRKALLSAVAGMGIMAADAQAARITSYTYTPEGQVATIDGPRIDVIDVTAHEYDIQGNRILIRNALGHETQTTTHDGAGRPLTIIDPNGLTTQLTYDPRGRLISQSVTDGTDTRVTNYTYDPVGNLTQVTSPDGSVLKYEYDDANRLIRMEDGAGNRIDYILDAMGNRLETQVTDPSGALKQHQQQVYNQLGRLIQNLDAQNHTTGYAYDANGNLTEATDANLNPTAQAYDALDRLQQTTDALNGTTQYTYDTQDNLTSVTDPNGLTTSYSYDYLGNLTSQTSPDTGTTTYTYDEAGNRLTQTDARGITVNYSYDALNRLTQISYPDSNLNVSYTYDQGIYGIGRLTSMTDGQGTTDYTYNAFGQPLGKIRTSTDLIVTTFTYVYDNTGRLTRLTYPSGQAVEYGYDAQRSIESLSLAKTDGAIQPLISNIQQLPFGPIQAYDYGNGLSLTRIYDQDYRLIEQTVPGIQQGSYLHDPVGNITDWINLLNTVRDQQFGYDQLDRLTNASGAYGDLGYSYDATGNRLSLTNGTETDTYTYAPGSHQLQQILSNSTDSRSYDAAGNTIQSLIGSYSYDDSNRLTGFSKSGVTAEYAYNGKGERIKKTVNGITTRFRYADSGQLLGEYDGTGQAIREYVYLGETPVAMLQSTTPTSQTLLQAVSTSHLSQQVSLGNHISQPVVIAGPPTNNGTQGAIVALSNITNTSANVSVQEWNYLDGAHLVEDISLLALPAGRYPQADGSTWEIGRFNLSGTKQWHDISFSEAFQTTPYLILTQQTRNDLETSVVRARNLSQTGFQASLSEQESLQNGHPEETIGYLAIHSPNTSGTARFYGADLNYQLSQISLNQNWAVAGEQQLKYQEEQSKDSETGHVLETVDILQLEGHLFAQDVSTAGGDPAAIRRQGTTPTVVIEGRVDGDTITYLHTDHLGAVVKATDSQQIVVWDAERKPFGERNVTTAQIEMPLGFPGQYFDQETNNYYNYFRDYDPTTGRYLQSDPIGLDGGINTYAYVEGNPIINIDYYGLYGEVGIRPFYPTPVPYARHCFLRFNGNNNDTLSFSNTGVGPDPNPGGAQYNPIPGTQDDACLRREMKKCGADHYRFCRFNCCRCVANAINACKLKDPGNWPNEPCDASKSPYPLPVPPWQDPMWDELVHGQ